MLLVLIQFLYATRLELIYRNGYILESKIQLQDYLYKMNTISKVNCTRYRLEELVPYKHPLHDINSKVNNGLLDLNLFIEGRNIKYLLKNDLEVFVKFEFTIFESKIFDDETLGFICKLHKTKDDFMLKIDKFEAFYQFLKIEYSNLINIFTFRKSLNNFDTEDENIRYLVEDLKNAIKNSNEDNQNSISDLIKNFIDHTKNFNPTIDLQFEAFMKFKRCLFNFINFELDTSLRFDIFDGENFMKITRCLKINILEHDNLNASNTEIELFDKEDNKIEEIHYLVCDKDIILFVDKLKENHVEYLIVHHKVNGRIKKSNKIFLK